MKNQEMLNELYESRENEIVSTDEEDKQNLQGAIDRKKKISN